MRLRERLRRFFGALLSRKRTGPRAAEAGAPPKTRTVLFCIGAAKAGTSWLHSQLAVHPECHFRTIKELHYFDALEQGELARQLKHHRSQQEELLSRLARQGRLPDTSQARRLEDRAAWLDVLARQEEDMAAYLRYLENGAGEARVVGEMTPAYALLPRERLARMAGLAPDVRFLYILRDPVERLWSHVRMMAVRRAPDGQLTPRRAARILDRTIAGDEQQIAARGDYAAALARLEEAVPSERRHLEVFEEMVAGPGLARICAFLGISETEFDAQPRHSGQALAMSEDQRARAARWLAPQYDAAVAALGRRPRAWRA